MRHEALTLEEAATLQVDDIDAILAERELREYVRFMWPVLETRDFVPNWHIDAKCDHLEAVSRGEIRRLIISEPPRHMKSLTVSVCWPSWTWIQDPDPDNEGHGLPIRPGTWLGPGVSFMYSSYAASLSIRDSVKCRRIIDSRRFRRHWGDRVQFTVDQNQKSRFQNTRGGERIATSVDGQLTGEGGDIIAVDDPHNVREAESAAVRESVLEWWDEAMQTRLNDPKRGAFVVIMQRVHERDLTGHILARNHGWDHLCLPARYEDDHPTPVRSSIGFVDPRSEGDLLWPARFGEDELAKLEAALGSYAAAGQLQQRPAPREGGLFKRHWFEIVKAAPANCEWVRHWDLAGTEKITGNDPDWTAGLKLGKAPDGRYYVADVRRERESPFEIEKLIRNTAQQDGYLCRISLPQDPGQAGKMQAQYMVGQLAGFIVKAAPESGSKDTRAAPVSAQAEAGNVKLVEGAWNDAFLEEVSMFPNGAFDDQVDALSGAFSQLVGAGYGMLDVL